MENCARRTKKKCDSMDENGGFVYHLAQMCKKWYTYKGETVWRGKREL